MMDLCDPYSHGGAHKQEMTTRVVDNKDEIKVRKGRFLVEKRGNVGSMAIMFL